MRGKRKAETDRILFFMVSQGVGWLIPDCARLSHPPTHWHAGTCHEPWRGPSDYPNFPRGSRQIVLHCAHRATTALSWGLCEQEERSACSLASFGGRALREQRGRPGYPVFFCGSSNFSPFLNTAKIACEGQASKQRRQLSRQRDGSNL